jgi:hypothetical protein
MTEARLGETGGRRREEDVMDQSSTAVAPIGGWRAITRYQWLVFLVVWLGWTLDAADFGSFRWCCVRR